MSVYKLFCRAPVEPQVKSEAPNLDAHSRPTITYTYLYLRTYFLVTFSTPLVTS